MSFRDIKGQDKPISILKKYLSASCLRGSFLFIGQEGIGKRLTAKAIAKAINCEKPGSDSCDRCGSCIKIENNQHPDVHLIEGSGAGSIKIDVIRQLRRDISLKPYEAKCKVFIIDNAHNLSKEAANAFLKILEEPAKDSLIILITDKPNLLFKTVISRCKIIKFNAMERKSLKAILKEGFGLAEQSAHLLAYLGEGRLGYALRMKDSFALKEKNDIIDRFTAGERPHPESLNVQDREGLRRLLNILAVWFRDLYLLKIGLPHSEIINLDRRADLLKQMSRFSFLDLERILEAIPQAMLRLEQNVNTKLLLHELGAQLWKG